jgi:hypothetical protein
MMVHWLLTLALGCAPPASSDLTGLWESTQTSTGGIGNSVEFRADGTFVESPIVLVNGHYRVEGNRMFLTERADERTSKDTRQFRIDGTTMVIESPDGQSLRMDRIDRSGGTSIVGAWRYRHDTGQMAFERYLPDGRMNFRLPMKPGGGCYSIGPDGLRLAGQGGPVLMQYERKGDSLVLRTAGRAAASYAREPSGLWFEWPGR